MYHFSKTGSCLQMKLNLLLCSFGFSDAKLSTRELIVTTHQKPKTNLSFLLQKFRVEEK